jgi:hypothetical protein
MILQVLPGQVFLEQILSLTQYIISLSHRRYVWLMRLHYLRFGMILRTLFDAGNVVNCQPTAGKTLPARR